MYRQVILQILPEWHFLNNQVCFSHVPLRKNFQKSLEVIRNCNNAQKFCAILINAREVIQEPKSFHPPVEVCLNKDELVAHSIICELKEFIHKDKPEYILIDTILKHNSSRETRHQLISLLFSIDSVNFLNSKNQSSREYLKCFISDVECFLSADKNHSSFVLGIQGDLKRLETELFSHSDNDVCDLKYTVRSAIFDEGHQSDEHHREIEALVSDAVSLLSTRLLQLNSASKSIIEKCLRARRSSLAIDIVDSSLEHFYLDKIMHCYYVLDKVPFYYMTKKERLLQYLKDTKSSNNAREFFELLSLINILNLDTDLNKESLNSDLIMNRLKDIIHSEKPEYHINKFILMSLQNRTHHLKELSELISRFFLDVDNFDCGKQNSEEYLMHFMQEFERLINLYDNHRFISQNILGAISETLRYIRRSCTADLQKAILCKYQLHFFGEEKKRIGFLMVEAITSIEEYVYKSNIFQVPGKIKSFLLLQRSSLQYFKDFFDSFPVGETPLKRFDMIRIDLCIQKLDEYIETMCEDAEYCANPEESDEEETELIYFEDAEYCANPEDEDEEEIDLIDYDDHDDLEKDGASIMPQSHVWWAKCIQTLNNIRIS